MPVVIGSRLITIEITSLILPPLESVDLSKSEVACSVTFHLYILLLVSLFFLSNQLYSLCCGALQLPFPT